jgi:60 kDa SS-A/Ro ribonucleoprotein
VAQTYARHFHPRVTRQREPIPGSGQVPNSAAGYKGWEVDTFQVFTDSETWFGSIHPCQALLQYPEKTDIPARLILVGKASNGFSIADSNDAGTLDVVRFDTAAPNVMSAFARGTFQVTPQ